MRLLVVTDHRFYATPDGIYDTYCFDREFFDDYLSIFDQVRVAARVAWKPPPSGARRSDGDGLEFYRLPDKHGASWVLTSHMSNCRTLVDAVDWSDAVCVRLPSVSGKIAFDIADNHSRPVMFELIGDPAAAIDIRQHGLVSSVYGRLMAHSVKQIVRRASVGSYVSSSHLQQRYPPGPCTVHDSISSIRLPASSLVPARKPRSGVPLSVIFIASLVPVKCHDVLIRAVAGAAKQGAVGRLELVGDGVLRPRLEALTRQLGLRGIVNFHGHVASRRRIDDLLDSSDVFVMTSASEGLPRAMIEAMARGLPAIGTNAPGIAELLPEEQLIPIGDSVRLSEMLVLLSRDRTLLQRFAQHSERVVMEYTQERLSERRRRLLTELASMAVNVNAW